MTKNTWLQGYEEEIRYQKHMLDNLGRWFSLLSFVASLGVLLVYFFRQTLFPLFLIGLIFLVLGVLGMLTFGYGIYKGKKNLSKVIDAFDAKCSH